MSSIRNTIKMSKAILHAVRKTVRDTKYSLFDQIRDYVISNMDASHKQECDDLFDSFKTEFLDNATHDEENKDNVSKVRRKRKVAPYNKFLSEEMKRFKSEDSTLSGKEVMKKALESWQSLSEDEKINYRAKINGELLESNDVELEIRPHAEGSVKRTQKTNKKKLKRSKM